MKLLIALVLLFFLNCCYYVLVKETHGVREPLVGIKKRDIISIDTTLDAPDGNYKIVRYWYHSLSKQKVLNKGD